MTNTAKTILGLIVAVLVVWGIYSILQKPSEPTITETIKIGAILPLTGPVASQGESEKNAIKMAVEDRNLQGGINGKKIELIIEDTTLSAKTAVSVFNKLFHIDKIRLFIGPSPSVEIAAIAPIIEKENAIMINFGGGSSPHSQYGENAFISSAVFGFEVPRMVEHVEKQGYKNIAFLGVKTDSVIQALEIFQQELKGKNINLAQKELLSASNKDFRTSLLKIKESKPDAIYLLHFPAFIGMILKEKNELKIDIPTLTYSMFEDPVVLQIAGADSLKGVVYTIPVRKEKGEEYFKKYELKYGKKPVPISDNAYDAINLLMDALQKNEDIESIREYLKNVKNYDGAGGVFSVNENKDAVRDYVVKVYGE